jgi:hypothetical protein
MLKQIKSVQLPFKTQIDKGEKIEEHTYEAFDHKIKGRYVPEPKTGIRILKQYDSIVKNHFEKKVYR